MADTVINAAPEGILHGVDDQSTRPVPTQPEQVPTHCPVFLTFCERGDESLQLVLGESAMREYGTETFNMRGKFANHQTAFMALANQSANQFFNKRLRPTDANAPATIRFSVDVMPDKVQTYKRDIMGHYQLDEQGERIPDGDPVDGLVLRWLTEVVNADGLGQATAVQVGTGQSYTDRVTDSGTVRVTDQGQIRILENLLGNAVTQQGRMVNGQGDQSTIYPIAEFEIRSFGNYGNNIGIRLSAPTTQSPSPTNANLVEDQQAFMFRLQLVERNTKTQTVKVLKTIEGGQSLDFMFKEGALDLDTDQELWFDDIFLPTWNRGAQGGYPAEKGPIGRFHIYYNYLAEVQKKIQAVEAPYGYVPEGEEGYHLANPFSAVTVDNVAYQVTRVRGPIDDGILMSESSTYYCAGGSDGTMSAEMFDNLVRDWFLNFGEGDDDVLNDALYPMSAFWDSGFSMDTKKAMAVPLGKRKDLFVVVATQDVNRPLNSQAEENSIAASLRAAFRNYPESALYGTPTMRAIIMGNSGKLIDRSGYRGVLPFTYQFLKRVCDAMGNGNGRWNTDFLFDQRPYNQVDLFDVDTANITYRQGTQRNTAWERGLNWAENYSIRRYFWPAIQTVYDNDTSILNGAITMMAVVEVEKVCRRVWRDITGRSDLSNVLLIQLSNEMIEERLRKRFGNRFRFVPDTYLTAQDEARGYSWSCNVNVYGPNMKTVGQYTITAHRIEDYQE